MTNHPHKENCPNFEKVKNLLHDSPDLICRTLDVSGKCIEIIFMKNLIKPELLNEYVIKYIQQLPMENITYSYLIKNIPMEELTTDLEEQKLISSLLKFAERVRNFDFLLQ